MKKKLLILLSTMTMVFSLIVPSAFAQGETCTAENNILYSTYLESECVLPSNEINCFENDCVLTTNQINCNTNVCGADVQNLLNKSVSDCVTSQSGNKIDGLLENVKSLGIKGICAEQLASLCNVK